VLAQVNEGLRAAAISEEGRELLARGRFTEPPKATGFDAFAGIEVPNRPPRRAQAKAAKPKRDDTKRREAQAQLRELERKLAAAEHTVRALNAEVEAARRRLEKLS
jgi:molecular chaperone GrpE (heat shock protein)